MIARIDTISVVNWYQPFQGFTTERKLTQSDLLSPKQDFLTQNIFYENKPST